MGNEKRLRRSKENKVIAGVCAGVANFLSLPVMSIRIGFIVLSICAGLGLWGYLGMWIIIPTEKQGE